MNKSTTFFALCLAMVATNWCLEHKIEGNGTKPVNVTFINRFAKIAKIQFNDINETNYTIRASGNTSGPTPPGGSSFKVVAPHKTNSITAYDGASYTLDQDGVTIQKADGSTKTERWL